MSDFNEEVRTFGTIQIEAATITPTGVSPGSAKRKIVWEPEQYFALRKFFRGSIEALDALHLIIQHGTLALDPLRIEVQGWGREWLKKHGMRESPARKAAAIFKDIGFMEPVYGPNGAAGGALGVLAGEHFGWTRATTEVISPTTGRPRLAVVGSQTTPGADAAERGLGHVDHASDLDETAFPQVSAIGRMGATREPEAAAPVDNPVWWSGAQTHNPVPADGGLGTSRPDARVPNRQVSAFGQQGTEPESTPPPSKEVEEEVSLLRRTVEPDLPLTRSALLRLIAAPEVVSAARVREADTLAALCRIFSRTPSSATGACEFLGLPPLDDPAHTLAWFTYQAITDEARRAEICGALRERFRATGTHIESQGTLTSSELIGATVLALVTAQDGTPRKWPGYVVWAARNDDFSSSSSVRALTEALNALAFALDAPAPTQPSLTPESSAASQTSPLAAFAPPPKTRNNADLSLSEAERLNRGEQYVTWLIETVLPGSHFDAVQDREAVLRNPRIQDSVIERYYRLQA